MQTARHRRPPSQDRANTSSAICRSTWCMDVDRPIAKVMMPHKNAPSEMMLVRSYLSPNTPLIGEDSACSLLCQTLCFEL